MVAKSSSAPSVSLGSEPPRPSDLSDPPRYTERSDSHDERTPIGQARGPGHRAPKGWHH